MAYGDFFELAVAGIKDKISQEIYRKFRDSSNKLLEADADARRSKARQNILAMARLKIELNKFCQAYDKVKEETGSIPKIEEYIRDIQARIKVLSRKKNTGIYD